MSGFTKLWTEITDSSIWNEDDKTRIVWITMLARMGGDSMVRASVGGLAHLARVSREDCEKALTKLESPDPDSRSSHMEGRRIERVEGGFFIINGQKYRDRRGDEERREYMRQYMQKYRKNKLKENNVNTVNKSKPELAQAEAEAEAECSKERASLNQEAAIPNLDEVKEYANMIGALEKSAISFWEWHEFNNAWLKNGRLIPWKKKLPSWAAKDKEYKSNGKGNGNKSVVDRNQGTANAGKGNQYAGVGRVVPN